MIIDAHTHLADDFDISKSYEFPEIDKIMVCAICNDKHGNNDIVKQLMEKHNNIIGFAYIDLDKENISNIFEYKKQGFLGYKIIGTKFSYDDEKYLDFYGEIESLNMPILFHCGYLGTKYIEKINCNNYRPMTLDTIARQFPRLKMICAHMGSPWWDEAALVIAKHENIYGDMSGLSVWQRDIGFWIKTFKPNGEWHPAVYKLIFGSDSFIFGKMNYTGEELKLYNHLFSCLDLPKTQMMEQILSKNFLGLVYGHE